MKASIAIAAALRTKIASGELAFGDVLPVEEELTAEFGCSKPVVREALRILETEGLVEVKRGPGGGPRVCRPSVGHAASGMGVYLRIGDVPVGDVWAARDRIVGTAVERLATCEGVDLAALEVELAALAASVGDMATFNELLLDLAELAVRLAGNATESLLVATLRHIVDAELATATGRAGAVGTPAVQLVEREERHVVDAWEQVLVDVRAGDGAGARAAYEAMAATLRVLVLAGAGDPVAGPAAAR